ncbi:MAG TPA: FAD/NAD(P)-binding oxidoreductase [Candidatus Aquicultor sp.]
MAKNIVIVGGGSGGTIVANHLAGELKQQISRGDTKVTLVTDTPNHVYQPSFLYITINQVRLEDYTRSEKSLLKPGVELLIDPAVKIDTAGHTVATAGGKTLPYDILVIATGSYLDPTTIPGLAEAADVFYTAEGAEKLRDKIVNFAGGTILMTVDVPHKCPAAPLELIFILDDFYRHMGIRDKVNLIYTYPIGRLHSLEPVANFAAPEFEKRGINSETFFNVESVDPQKKVVTSLEGSEVPFDVLISIPAHRGAHVVHDSGLGDEDGFIPTNRYTLKADGYDDIYVIGDATALPISKAGSTAHYQADVVTANIISQINGLPPSRFYDGKVACFVEMGLDKATFISFDYNNPPVPLPVSEMIHWFKLSFNEIYWLSQRGLL